MMSQKYTKNLIFSFWGLLLGVCLKAQRVYTTPYPLSGTANSPAQTGLFAGSYRIESLYFSQLQTQNIKGIQSVLCNVDAPLSSFTPRDWIGLGLNMAHDVSNFVGLATTEVGMSAAYHKGLDGEHRTMLSVGGQVNYIQRSIDASNLVFQNDLLKNNPGLDLQRLNIRNQNYFDANVGVNLRISPRQGMIGHIGAHVEHLLTPYNNFGMEKISKLARNFVYWSSVESNIGSHYLFKTGVYVKKTPFSTDITTQLTGGIRINDHKHIRLNGGIGYQNSGAAQILVGFDYDKLRFGLTYQTRFNYTDTNNLPDFLGLAVSYTGLIYRKPNPPATLLCPPY
jgi:type IX secretion system PorP/SprF family membrane protein